MARLEPTWMYLRRLYDLPVLSVAGTLSITSGPLSLAGLLPLTVLYFAVFVFTRFTLNGAVFNRPLERLSHPKDLCAHRARFHPLSGFLTALRSMYIALDSA
ncbi:hypothetical protein DJ56_3096 [Yersinia pestis]|nr:hypothetical protein DJ56_3096 [Yersinia pestis]KNX84898.1 hypothetical protein ACX52_39 [Yersinia pestis]